MRSLAVVVCLLAAFAAHMVLAACPYRLQAHGIANNLEYTGQRSILGDEWRKGVESLPFEAIKKDIAKILTKSQAFWPADFGNYGGFIIRLAWHCAGSYRKSDGRGGCDGGRIRFSPEGAWPDNGNLEKALRLLEPVKSKYGKKLSWGDLIILAGNTAIESMGGPKLHFCAGRVDDEDGSASLELGPGKEQDAVAPCKDDGACKYPLGPTTLGLIYVNPEGPKGVPKPTLSAPQIRATFHGNMGFTDEETVALIGGGHAFGKTHGACPKAENGACGILKGPVPKTLTSGFEVVWTTTPTQWSNEFFRNLLEYEFELTKSPAGHHQWEAVKHKPGAGKGAVPKVQMLTADLALLEDPGYLKFVKLFAKDQKALEKAFAAAWYKLTTNDMGPAARCLGKLTAPPQSWQCDLPAFPKTKPDYKKVAGDIKKALTKLSNSLKGDSVKGTTYYGAFFSTLAYNSAMTFRSTDYSGGVTGARIRFSPEKDFRANIGLDKVLDVLQPIKSKHSITWADLIVLAGTVASEQAIGVSLSFCEGRADATSGCGEVVPRNYYPTPVTEVKDNAKILGLSLREYVALAARLRSPSHLQLQGYSGSWTSNPATLSNKFFKTLLGEKWVKSKSAKGKTEYKADGKKGVYVLPTDYALVDDGELKAIVKEFASDSNAFESTFGKAWDKLMNAGRYGASAYAC